MNLGAFVARTFLWLPACFLAGYFVAPWHSELLAWLARGEFALVRPGLIAEVERTGTILAFASNVESRPIEGRIGFLVPELNALLHIYGVPLFVALMLAARAPLPRLALGMVALLPFQAAGIVLACLVQFLGQGAEPIAAAGLVGWRGELVALGYQFAVLLLPTLGPIVAWGLCSRAFIAQLAREPRLDAAPGQPGP